MASRRKRPVLYEVVSRSRRGRARASAWRAPSPTTQSTTPPDKQPPAPPTPETPVAHVRTPSFRIVGNRMHLMLGWPQLTVIGVSLLVVLVAVFQAGKRSVQPPVPAGSDDAQLFEQPTPDSSGHPRTSVSPSHRPTDGNAATPRRSEKVNQTNDRPTANRTSPPPAQEPPPQPVLQGGYYYVLVQYFPKRRPQHAEAAAQFLRSKGVDCVVRQRPDDLMLLATERFPNARQAEGLTRRIRRMGEEYARSGGGYAFEGAQPLKL